VEVAAGANELGRIALGGPGAEVASADGWEADVGAGEGHAGAGGHANGACEGDEEGGDGCFGVIAEGVVVGQEQGEGWEFVWCVTKVVEEGGACGQDFGGKWGFPDGEKGGCGEVCVVQDILCCEEVGKGGQGAKFEKGGSSLFVGCVGHEAVCLAVECVLRHCHRRPFNGFCFLRSPNLLHQEGVAFLPPGSVVVMRQVHQPATNELTCTMMGTKVFFVNECLVSL
jgi:hypothetical protein